MKLRLSPSTVVAAIALIAALGGTAYAAGAFTKAQKKQVEKIATRVFDSRVGDASVKRAATAGKAETADRATEALHAAAATKVDVASKADLATKVPQVPQAREATRADSAMVAETAVDTPLLGGEPPGNFQNRVAVACRPPEVIASVGSSGSVACTTPVQAVRIELGPNGTGSENLANGLRIEAGCGDPADPFAAVLFFRNIGAATARSSFMIGDRAGILTDGFNVDPGKTVGTSIRDRSAFKITWATPSAVTTLNLSLFRSVPGTFCEVTGTAMTAGG